MPTAMTNDPSVKQKSLRIQLPTENEEDIPVVPPMDAITSHTMPKSILRNRRNDATTNATEAPSPLQSESYFLGPLRTLVASVSVEEKGSGFVSIHDITEAYILLSCRIEAQAANLDDDATPAVLSVRKLPSHAICAAIRRDVAYAIPETKGSDDLRSSQVRMTDEERSSVKDQSNICHAALRFLASFLRFPSLHQTLKLHERTWILKELLDVGLCSDLVTINPQKTYSHVIGVLYSEHLSDSVLKPLRSRISSVVERAASGTLGGNTSNGPHIEGLKVIYALLHRHGSLLFPEFSGVFKVVLQNLVCPIPTFRDLAAKVLTAFAHAILRCDVTMEDQLKLSSIVDAFIDKEIRRAKDFNQREPSPFVLRCFLKLSEDDPNIIKRVTQLLNIVAALLVISGPCVFIRPNSLKFLIKAVGKTQNFRHRELNILRAATWSCLVRAYGLLPSWDIPRYDGLEESAFRVIRQEYREDVSVSVLAVLLGVHEEEVVSLDRVREAITYLHHLGQMPETRIVATKLLRRLLGAVLNDDSDICTWTGPASVVPDWLSNGSTLEMEPRTLRKSLSSLPGTDIRVVRNLEANELIAIWQHIAEAFQVCAIGQLFDKKTENALQDDILLLWQVFLKIKSSLDSTFNPTVVAKPELECLATVLCAILDTPDARYPIRPAQAFTATHQLWKLVNDEFGHVWGSALAGSIYRRLLKACQYEAAGDALSDEWVQFSRSLVSASPKRTMEILSDLHDVDAQRVLWLDMARYMRFQERPSKETILYLLLFPLQVSEDIMKEESDIGYWDMLFLLSLMHNEPEVIFSAVAEEIHRALSFKPCTEVQKFLKISVTRASVSESPPNIALLSVVNDYLEESYPPDGNEISELAELVPILQKLLTASAGLDALFVLKNGLTPWFEDRKLSIPDVTYNNDVLPLYCDMIHAIRRASPIEDIVVNLADFLAAPFRRERIPKPAVGPIAFKEFWDSVGPTLDFNPQSFPPVLTHCVTSLYDAYGVYIPDWMASQIESETHASVAEFVVPPSIEDLPSSDFSPASSKRPAKTDDCSPKRKNTKITPNRTPEVSPSIGEPSPQFSRYRPVVPSTSPSVSLGPGRAKKKRKQSGMNIKTSQRGSAPVCDLRQVSPRHRDEGQRDHELSAAEMVPSHSRQEVSIHSPVPDEDYASWEVNIASQDVRDILEEDNDKTARPLDSPPNIQDNASGNGSVRLHGKSRQQPQVRTEHPIDRSRTAPACMQSPSQEHQCAGEISSSEQNGAAAKLRRMHTTTDVPLDALEKLHARLSEEADSMQTQDLAQATRLTYDVLGILNGRMSEKLRKRK